MRALVVCSAAVLALSFLDSPASARPVQVDWSVVATGSEPGVASGSLGVFDVVAGNETLSFASDLSADWVSENYVGTFVQYLNNGVSFRFNSFSSGELWPEDAGSYIVLGDPATAYLVLAAQESGPDVLRAFSFGTLVSEGAVTYTFTAVPEPSTGALAAVVGLVAVWARARSRRCARS